MHVFYSTCTVPPILSRGKQSLRLGQTETFLLFEKIRRVKRIRYMTVIPLAHVISGVSRNLLALYREWRSVIGCDTHRLFCDG